MPRFDIETLKKHPLGVAVTIAIGAISLTSAFWYILVVEDLRDKKAELATELQMTKQRVSSLETTLATYDGQCASKLQAQSKETRENCDRQLSSAMESSKVLASSHERLLDEIQRRDRALAATSVQLNNQQASQVQLRQLKLEEKALGDRVAALHVKHQKLSGRYGYSKAECEKNDFYSGNICEHASMNRSELDSIEREIDSTKLRLSQIQQQILQQQSSAK
jgi:hypothetical protein